MAIVSVNWNKLRRRSGKRYEGLAAWCHPRHADVPFEGHFALKENKDGYSDPDGSKPLKWVEECPDDPDHFGGWYEYL